MVALGRVRFLMSEVPLYVPYSCRAMRGPWRSGSLATADRSIYYRISVHHLSHIGVSIISYQSIYYRGTILALAGFADLSIYYGVGLADRSIQYRGTT